MVLVVLVDVVVTVVLRIVVVFVMVVEFDVWFGMLNIIGLCMPLPRSLANPKIARPSSNAVSNNLNALGPIPSHSACPCTETQRRR